MSLQEHNRMVDDTSDGGAEAERAAVVAWLRREGHRALADSIAASGDDGVHLWAFGDARIRAADAIERGDHLSRGEGE
jgi:hypothetical protein